MLEVKVDHTTGLIILATPVPGVGVGDGVRLGEGLIDGLGVRVGVGVGAGVGVGVAVGVGVGIGVGAGVGVGVAVAVGVGVGVGVASIGHVRKYTLATVPWLPLTVETAIAEIAVLPWAIVCEYS